MRTHLDIQHTGTLGDANRTKMKFDENSIAHLMSVLTDLYSNPQLAVIREYSTNALDSQRSAGYVGPIEVTLPTSLNASFVVEDHGTGMSLDDITNNFSKYGWSSKRETDDEVGMLGLGCKSALSYTSQFTMVSRHNGLEITVLVTRDSDGAGAVQIVDTVPTTEPNGVRITVPVRNVFSFNTEAELFYSYWEPNTVLVNGKPPEPFSSKSVMELDPDVHLHSGRSDSRIIMGNISYPIDKGKFGADFHGMLSTSIVARVPIGTVNFTPSREALQYTKRTIDTLETIAAFVTERTPMVVTAALADAENPREAIQRHDRWNHLLWESRPVRGRYGGRSHVQRVRVPASWQGREIPSGFDFEQPSKEISIRQISYGADKSETINYLNALNATEVALWVTGMTANHVGASIKAKARQVCDRLDIHHGRIMFVPSIPTEVLPWLHEPQVIAMAQLKLEVLPKQEKNTKPIDPMFTVIGPRGLVEHDPVRTEAEGGLLCWVEAKYVIEHGHGDIYSLVGAHRCARVLKVKENAFRRAHPNLPTIEEYVGRLVVAPEMIYGWNGIVVRRQDIDLAWLSALDGFTIADPALRAMRNSYLEWAETCDRVEIERTARAYRLLDRKPSLPVNPTLVRYYQVAEPYKLMQEVIELNHYPSVRNRMRPQLMALMNDSYLVRNYLPEYLNPNPNTKEGTS